MHSHLPPHSAAILLGTLFAYPFHEKLRETFGLVPVPWLISPDKVLLRKLAVHIQDMFFSDPMETYHFMASKPDIPAMNRRFAAHPYQPWHLEDWIPSGSAFSQYLRLTLDMGCIPSGIYGTIHHRVLISTPPIVTSRKGPTQPEQASRFLFFTPHAAAEDSISPFPVTAHPSETLQELLSHKSFPKKALSLAKQIERELAPIHWLPLRRRIQLAIAYAHYVCAEEILSPHPQDPEALLNTITTEAVFDSPKNLQAF